MNIALHKKIYKRWIINCL